MGVSENRGPQYSTLNSRILIIRTPKISKVPPVFGNSLKDPEFPLHRRTHQQSHASLQKAARGSRFRV